MSKKWEDVEIPSPTIEDDNVAKMLWEQLDIVNKLEEEINAPFKPTQRYLIEYRKEYKEQLWKDIHMVIAGAVAVCISNGIEFDKGELAEFEKGDHRAMMRIRAKIMTVLPAREKAEHVRNYTMYPQRSPYSSG